MIRLADPLHELRTRLGLPSPLPKEPMHLLASWAEEARRAKDRPNPNAMVLATAAPDGTPSARVVLCKAIEDDPAAIVFFTSFASRKAAELEANPRAACVFHWDNAGRQARAEGRVTRVSDEENDEYFRSRPLLARLAAWASQQGQPIAGRGELIDRVRTVMDRFDVGIQHLAGLPGAPEIPRPPHWGGYRVLLDSVELWLGGAGRLHDRAIWKRDADSPDSLWTATRIQP